MSTSDPLIADFERLLDRFPDTFTLEQWQFAYKRVIFAMGVKILELFPRNAYGPEPLPMAPGGGGQVGGAPGSSPTQAPRGGPGPHVAGGWPGGGQGPIIHVAIAALELAPPPPPP